MESYRNFETGFNSRSREGSDVERLAQRNL